MSSTYNTCNFNGGNGGNGGSGKAINISYANITVDQSVIECFSKFADILGRIVAPAPACVPSSPNYLPTFTPARTSRTRTTCTERPVCPFTTAFECTRVYPVNECKGETFQERISNCLKDVVDNMQKSKDKEEKEEIEEKEENEDASSSTSSSESRSSSSSSSTTEETVEVTETQCKIPPPPPLPPRRTNAPVRPNPNTSNAGTNNNGANYKDILKSLGITIDYLNFDELFPTLKSTTSSAPDTSFNNPDFVNALEKLLAAKFVSPSTGSSGSSGSSNSTDYLNVLEKILTTVESTPGEYSSAAKALRTFSSVLRGTSGTESTAASSSSSSSAATTTSTSDVVSSNSSNTSSTNTSANSNPKRVVFDL